MQPNPARVDDLGIVLIVGICNEGVHPSFVALTASGAWTHVLVARCHAVPMPDPVPEAWSFLLGGDNDLTRTALRRGWTRDSFGQWTSPKLPCVYRVYVNHGGQWRYTDSLGEPGVAVSEQDALQRALAATP